MNSYETMFIIKPDMNDQARDSLCKDISASIVKVNGKVANQQIWADKRKLTYPIKKYQDGTYFLLTFDIDPSEIVNLRQNWKLNEGIIRFQILKLGVK